MLRTLITALLFAIAACGTARASDTAFFNAVEGKWSGPGEIVAGKYKGTKFTCVFSGVNPAASAGMKIDDIDLYEVNEAFAPVPIAWLKHHGADPAKLNVNGGAIALGHPLGASGTKLMTTLIYALRARGKKYGLQTMCEGGGIANVTIIEAL